MKRFVGGFIVVDHLSFPSPFERASSRLKNDHHHLNILVGKCDSFALLLVLKIVTLKLLNFVVD